MLTRAALLIAAKTTRIELLLTLSAAKQRFLLWKILHVDQVCIIRCVHDEYIINSVYSPLTFIIYHHVHCLVFNDLDLVMKLLVVVPSNFFANHTY